MYNLRTVQPTPLCYIFFITPIYCLLTRSTQSSFRECSMHMYHSTSVPVLTSNCGLERFFIPRARNLFKSFKCYKVVLMMSYNFRWITDLICSKYCNVFSQIKNYKLQIIRRDPRSGQRFRCCWRQLSSLIIRVIKTQLKTSKRILLF